MPAKPQETKEWCFYQGKPCHASPPVHKPKTRELETKRNPIEKDSSANSFNPPVISLPRSTARPLRPVLSVQQPNLALLQHHVRMKAKWHPKISHTNEVKTPDMPPAIFHGCAQAIHQHALLGSCACRCGRGVMPAQQRAWQPAQAPAVRKASVHELVCFP